jgi:hypothetical protein
MLTLKVSEVVNGGFMLTGVGTFVANVPHAFDTGNDVEDTVTTDDPNPFVIAVIVVAVAPAVVSIR